MNLEFKTTKLKKQCENPSEAQKIYGPQIGLKLTLRVNEFRASTSLLDVSKNKANGFHALEGERKGEYAVTLVHPFRLVFSADFDESKGSASLSSINVVRIEEVIDYHGKNKRK